MRLHWFWTPIAAATGLMMAGWIYLDRTAPQLVPTKAALAAEQADWDAKSEKRRLWILRYGDALGACKPTWCEYAGESNEPISTGWKVRQSSGERAWASVGDAYCKSEADRSNALARETLAARTRCKASDFVTPPLRLP